MPRKANTNHTSTPAQDISTLLRTEQFTPDELRLINDALHIAYRRDRARRLDEAQSSINGGEKVRLSGLRPKHLNGIIGKVGRFNSTQTRADITVESSMSWHKRKGDLLHGVPLVCMTKVD